MRDRLDGLNGGGVRVSGSPVLATGNARDQVLADAVSALVALGYRPPDASRMARAADDGAKTSEEIIRTALRSVNPP
jgi:Holliday junction DNA helicase RuvA